MHRRLPGRQWLHVLRVRPAPDARPGQLLAITGFALAAASGSGELALSSVLAEAVPAGDVERALTLARGRLE